MDKETIIRNEVENDGKSIYLYFLPEIGLYVAYGFSAFFSSHIVDVIAAFSKDYEMPLVLLRNSDLKELKRSMVRRKYEDTQNVRMELKREIELDDYVRWANGVKRSMGKSWI